jgi:hypothetical protein
MFHLVFAILIASRNPCALYRSTRDFQNVLMCIGKFHFTFAGFKVEIGAQTIMSN